MTKKEFLKNLETVDDDGEIVIYSIEAKSDEDCMPIPIFEVHAFRKELEIFIEI